jgi:hypothetical protein
MKMPLAVEQHQRAPMAEEDLEVGRAVEGAGEDEANELNAGVIVPAKAAGGECSIDVGLEARIISRAHCHVGCTGM